MFLELFCHVLHHERPDCDLEVLAALVDSPQQFYPGYVYKRIEKLDTDKRAYGWLPLMASSSGGQIGALPSCVPKVFLSVFFLRPNDVCHDGNTLLDTEDQHVGCVTYVSKIYATHA